MLESIKDFMFSGSTPLFIRADDVTEAIASKDRNNLYITSSFFRDPAKYRAFCAYYAVMRTVDDRIDQLFEQDRRSTARQQRDLEVVNAWEQAVRSCRDGVHPKASLLTRCDLPDAGAVCDSFIDTYRVFPVPAGLWTNFFSAMRSDLLEGEFIRWSDFLAYAEGATVAPTTIYLWLILARHHSEMDLYEIPQGLDWQACGRHLGIFAYLGHIIRDLAQDLTGKSARICIAREDMRRHGVTPEGLRKEASNGRASLATRGLVADLLERSRRHLAQGRALAQPAYGVLESDGRFILELIVTIYEHVIDKIERTGCDPMAGRHRLSRLEKAKIVRQVAVRTGFSLPHSMTV
jgi:phytoene/squalene synthetase